jgi:DNA-binding LacI/PurR family transcriptional regulator
VIADNVEGGQLAAQVLTAAGARHLGCLMPVRETYSVSGRARAFLEAAGADGLPAEVLRAEDQGYDAARAGILAADPAVLHRIDGLFCSTDLMALGALDALRLDLGLTVPGQLQVLGFDDIEQAGWASYDLTTIRQDIDAQADTVVRLLLDRIAGSTAPNRVEREPLSIVYRGTTRHVG